MFRRKGFTLPGSSCELDSMPVTDRSHCIKGTAASAEGSADVISSLSFPREILNFHSVLTAILGCKLPNVGQLLVKNPYIVLSQKEQDIDRVRKEIQALLTAIPLLADDQYSADNVMQELLLAVSRKDLEPFARHLRNSSSQKR